MENQSEKAARLLAEELVTRGFARLHQQRAYHGLSNGYVAIRINPNRTGILITYEMDSTNGIAERPDDHLAIAKDVVAKAQATVFCQLFKVGDRTIKPGA